MAIERALLANAQSYVLVAKAQEIVRREVWKGCLPVISSHPVMLEPVYKPIRVASEVREREVPVPWTLDAPPPEGELVRLQVWISPDQQCDWLRSEVLLKQLACVRRRVALEILGNQERIAIQLLCHRDDLLVVQTAFAGPFEQCRLSICGSDVLRELPSGSWDEAEFWDFYPPPPYSHLFTSPEELKRSPYPTLVTALAGIPPPALGIYQVVFAPVSPDHDWHQNVQALVDLEYAIKLQGGLSSAQRYAQQIPSGDLRQMAMDVEVKAHNDKPFFAGALRIGAVGAGPRAEAVVRSLAVVASLIQHGGRPLDCVLAEDYRSRLSCEAIRSMFTDGLTHRPGFLLNSWELVSLVHVPPFGVIEHLERVLSPLETLPPGDELRAGTHIGFCTYADVRQPVCIPDNQRDKHAHFIGGTGMGKSSTMEHMCLQDISRGHGVTVIDPHGTLVQRLLGLIPREHADRVIYVNPGDPNWVTIWNPLRCRSAVGPYRIADDLVGAFKRVVEGWGDRLEHLLRHAILALAHLEGASLLDVSDLLRPKSEESDRLRSLILKAVDDEVSRQFWRQGFQGYTSADLAPPQHKLSKLLTSGTVSLMLSQSDSSFDLRDVMDSGKLLLVDLSSVGSEVRVILGCFLLSLLYQTALTRGTAPDDPQLPFHIFCDEAHLFMTDAIEDLVAQMRKFKVSLTLAHQYLRQFPIQKADALSTVGSTIIFRVNTADARRLIRGLQGLVEEEDLFKLDVGQAIARIGSHVVRFRTLPPLEIPEDNCRMHIIERCRSLYYRPVDAVRRAIRRRGERWAAPLPSFEPYDTLDSAPAAHGKEAQSRRPDAPQSHGHKRMDDYDTF